MGNLLERGAAIVQKRSPERYEDWLDYVQKNNHSNYSMDAIRATCGVMNWLDAQGDDEPRHKSYEANRRYYEKLAWDHGDPVTVGGLTGFLTSFVVWGLAHFYYGMDWIEWVNMGENDSCPTCGGLVKVFTTDGE